MTQEMLNKMNEKTKAHRLEVAMAQLHEAREAGDEARQKRILIRIEHILDTY